MTKCIYCDNIFYDKGNLNKHQRTSKYCIKIQLERDSKIEHESYDCEYCKKKLTTKKSLNVHLKTCKIKLKEKDLLISLQNEVKKLKDDVINIKPVTITVTNTDNSININNYSSLLNYDPENITESLKKHYTIDHLLKNDQRNLADMTIKHFLSGKEQPMYYVTDRSRNKFMYTDKEHNEQEDSNALILRSLVYRGIKPIIKNLYNDEFKRLRKQLCQYQRKEITSMISLKHEELKDLEKAYRKMDIIEESDDYISQLSKCLPSSIRDRIYKDNLGMNLNLDDSDEEFKKQLEHETRLIGDYSVLELDNFKELFQKTGEIRGPLLITNNPKYLKEYIEFLKE